MVATAQPMSQCVACTEAEDADARHRCVAAQLLERVDGANDGAVAAARKDGSERAIVQWLKTSSAWASLSVKKRRSRVRLLERRQRVTRPRWR